MKSFYRISGLFTLTLVFACGGSNDPSAEEEGQVETPVAATLIFPENNTECQEGTIINDAQSNVAFLWNASEHTDSYEVHLKNLDSGSQTTHESDTNELEIVIERGTAYRWSVVSKSDATDEIAESEAWKFYNAGTGVIHHAPFPADLIGPNNGETVEVGSGSILLDWEASDIDGDIVSHEVFMGADNPPITSFGTTPETELRVDVIADSTDYWFVKTIDSVNNSSKSAVFSFVTE